MNLQGRKGRALDLMEKAYERSPGNFRVRSNLASLYAENGQTDRAVTLLEHLPRDSPHSANGWFNLALALFQNGDTVSADLALDQATRLEGLTPEQKEQIDRLRAAFAGSGSR